MISGMTLKNFRCFESTTLQFKSLNVISGFNRTGKSSIFDALKLMEDSGQVSKPDMVIDVTKDEAFRLYKVSSLDTYEFGAACFNLDPENLTYQWMTKIVPYFTPDDNHDSSMYRIYNLVDKLICAVEGDVLFMEYPEVGLHPVSQTILGQLIVYTATRGIQIFVETNSDHIFNSIRNCVNGEQISPSFVAFIHFTKPGVPVFPRITATGRFDHWPDGFFDEWDNALNQLLFLDS